MQAIEMHENTYICRQVTTFLKMGEGKTHLNSSNFLTSNKKTSLQIVKIQNPYPMCVLGDANTLSNFDFTVDFLNFHFKCYMLPKNCGGGPTPWFYKFLYVNFRKKCLLRVIMGGGRLHPPPMLRACSCLCISSCWRCFWVWFIIILNLQRLYLNWFA